MTISRRRFIQIAAASAATGFPSAWATGASAHRWRGIALGADCEIVLHTGREQFETLINRVLGEIREIEQTFSLYDENSLVSHLNKTGQLETNAHHVTTLFQMVDRAFSATEGLFDPTVQAIWNAVSRNQDADAAAATIGWDRIYRRENKIRLAGGQQVTFNGIAQGYATDVVRDLLQKAGLEKALINIGEHAAIGGPWRLGLSDPTVGHLGQMTLNGTAIATSSPDTLKLNDTYRHIIDPRGKGKKTNWSTISVEAKSATIADAFSTAFCHASIDEMRAMKKRERDIIRVIAADHDGDFITI